MISRFLRILSASLALASPLTSLAAEKTPRSHPNVIVILVDDMGQTDLA